MIDAFFGGMLLGAPILGILLALKSAGLPSSGAVALAVQGIPLLGYYLFFAFCHY